ncbi:unnamed protein product [Penicillium olsonii]|nr:unnamed protein product [Penicillium olsonii]
MSTPIISAKISFRCLYTHDLRRKSKRWHDGHLRYHKHNKRVMVYDDRGNFIGDHHWRSSDEVQDGDEMELENKGVLIEVCENMGTTETDITALYDKKRSSQGSPQNSHLGSQAPRSSTATSTPRYAGSSQSSRSLNDLLGIKKNPAQPFASPYEQRNPTQPAPQPTPQAVEQRAPKRQKVDQPTDENSRTQSSVIDLTESASRKNSTTGINPVTKRAARTAETPAIPTLASHQQRPAPSKPAPLNRSDPPRPLGRSISASSEVNSSLPSPQNLTRPSTRPLLSSSPLSSASTPAAPIHTRRPPGVLPSPISAITVDKEVTVPQEATRVDAQPQSRGNRPKDPPPNPTRPQRPIPPLARGSIPVTPNVPVTQSTAEKAVPSEGPRDGQIPTSNQPTVGQRGEAQGTRPPTQPPKRPPAPKISPLTSNAPTRPLSGELPSAASNSEQPTEVADVPAPRNMAPPSRPLPGKSSENPPRILRMGSGKPRKKLMYSALLPDASRTPSPTASNSLPASGKQRPAPEPKKPEKATDSVDSANSTPNDEFMPSSSTQSIFDEILDVSGPRPSNGALNGRRSTNAPLRKSLSDPSALPGGRNRTATSVNTIPIIEERKEQGPWTVEALDLFDFWPPGRPKPNEGNEDTLDDSP